MIEQSIRFLGIAIVMASVFGESDFRILLDQYGPQRTGPAVSREIAECHCRELASGHYENFPVLSVALPRAYRQDFANVYAFCRWADDLGDEIADSEESLELLEWWQRELDDCFADRVRHPVFVALRETIENRQLTQQPFNDLLRAFRQDQVKASYENFDELRDYCRHSADPVGRIVLRMCDCDSDENVALSDFICAGLQLINFWQDVARDLDRGRVYLPRDDCRQFGYSEADLNARVGNEAFVELMRFEVNRARGYLEGGLPLARRLPGRLRVVIAMFAEGGLRICDRLERNGYDVWRVRPKLSKADAGRILFKASRGALRSPMQWK